MGTATQSSNVSLPTTRIILALKKRAHENQSKPEQQAEFVEYSNVKRGKIGAALSLINRLAEEWYRQTVAWIYQLRGFAVIFDRHFIFEHADHARKLREQGLRFSDRIHLWSLYNLYPKPDLVLFLDAPIETLMARKREWPAERLQDHRNQVLEHGLNMPDFVRIDATQDVDKVVFDAIAEIMRVYESKTKGNS